MKKLSGLIKSIKNIKKQKKIIVGLALVSMVTVAVVFSSVGDAILASAIKRELPIYCVEKDSKAISLSFDAAWGNEDTEMLIDILGKYNIKATFFVVGEWVDKYPESVKALHDAGHEIMNHSDTHPHMTKLSKEKMYSELSSCNEKIKSVTGVSPILFRAPYGEYNDAVIAAAKSLDMYTIQWDVDSLDWKDISAEKITERVLERTNPGSIILFHNAAKNTPEALPEIIDRLIQKGYGFVPISELIMKENYTIDHSGKQIKADNYIQ